MLIIVRIYRQTRKLKPKPVLKVHLIRGSIFLIYAVSLKKKMLCPVRSFFAWAIWEQVTGFEAYFLIHFRALS